MRRNRIRAAVCAAALCIVAAAGALGAPAPPDTFAVRGSVIDRVVATVEDRAILRSDVDNELKRFLMQSRRTDIPEAELKQIRAQIVQGLVADALLAIEAEKEQITVDDREIDADVDRWVEETKTAIGGDEAFEAQLAAEGLTLPSLKQIYRDKVRTRKLIDGLIERKAVADLRVSDREIRDYYEAHLAEFPKRPATVNLARILVVPRPSPEVLAAARLKIDAAEKRLKAGEDFALVAREMSDCPSAKFGGSLGTIALEDLNNPAFEEAARAIKPGETGGPVLTDFGWHIIKVEKVEGDQWTVRHILAKAEAAPADVEAAAKLAERIRAETAAGADFAEAAAKYSDDASTKSAGGVLPETVVENLAEELREKLRGVPAGGVAPVFRDAKGFHVIKVLSWNEGRAYSFDEARDELARLVRQQKIQDRLGAYVDELKKSYAVHIRDDA